MKVKSLKISALVLVLGTASLSALGEPNVADPLNQATLNQAHVETYRQHVFTLANPYFEGRAPGTAGNLRAAEYLEFCFTKLGLEPAFTGSDGNASFRQTLDVGGRTVPVTQFAQITAGGQPLAMEAGTDFVAMDYSGNGVGSGQVVFVGYSIEGGPNGYTSFPAEASLEGKIALVLRFEPMTDDGKSRFSENDQWSPAAGLEEKLSLAAAKGAAGIILVNPPGASDARAGRLASLNSYTPNETFKIPVVMMTTEAADRLVRKADDQGRSLLDLRRLADEGTAFIPLGKSHAMLAAELKREGISTDNVAGIVRGKGDLADEFIVIGAHYDHVGYGNFGSLAGRRGAGQLHPGADDNASGTSGMLLLAERIAQAYAELPEDANCRSFMFMGFTAEEMGLIGSRYYTRNMALPKEAHYVMLNLDMIGRYRPDKFEVHGVGTAEEMESIIDPFLKNSGLEMARLPGGVGPSDHASFFNAGIPVLFFFTGTHEDYHRPGDVASLINFEGAVQITDMVYSIAQAMAERPEGLTYARAERRGVGTATPLPQGPSSGPTGIRVRFGIMPGDYSGSVKGILVDAVREGTSAAEAGLKQGDVITKWNGKPVASVEDWMPLLSSHAPGDEVVVTFLRDGKEMTGTCKLQGAATRG